MLGYSFTKNSQYPCSHSQGKHDRKKFSILARSSTFPMKLALGVVSRPSVMEVSPYTFGLSKSILLIDHRIAGIDSLNLVKNLL